MAVRIGIGGELGPLKEDCSNNISVQDREKGDEGGAGEGGKGSRRKIWKEALRGALKQEVELWGVGEFWRERKGTVACCNRKRKTTEAGQHTHVLALSVHKAREKKTCICSRTGQPYPMQL